MTSISSTSSNNGIAQFLMQQMQKSRADMFSKADTDGSGGLSLDEFTAMGANMPNAPQDSKTVEAMFTKLDTDGDGNLTQTELDAGAPKQDIGMLSQQVMSALLDILGAAEDTSSTASTSTDSTSSTTDTASAAGQCHASSSSDSDTDSVSTASSDSSSDTKSYDPLDKNKDGVVSLDEIMAGLMASIGSSSDTADSSQTASTTNKDSILAEMKTAVKNFFLQLQESQQTQIA